MPEVSKEVNLNTMTASEYKNENGYAEITLKNEKTETNSVKWKKQGNENVILTYIYDANVDLSNIDITAQEKVSLYNDKEITSNEGKVKLSNEEIDSAIEVKTSNSENRAGAKPKLLFSLNLAYNRWDEVGYLSLKR